MGWWRRAGAGTRHPADLYERPNHTLQATALVHDLYLRLAQQNGGHWKDRQHFFSFAAMMMRRILIDYARSSRDKVGASWNAFR
ncbi:MAG TPA: ECF-type sigma factor [Bryobacteraceae bacterium]|nr:ECF-type sigma factor [Bryobacteraceae bacterium]